MPSAGHSDIEDWFGRLMPQLQPIVKELDESIRAVVPGLHYAVKWKRAPAQRSAHEAGGHDATFASASNAATRRSRASAATGVSFRSPVAATMTSGFMASTRVRPSTRVRTMMLRGSSRPMEGAMVSAWWASGGLHAPRIRWGGMSMSGLAFMVAATSISVSNPEALFGQCGAHVFDGLGEACFQGDADSVVGMAMSPCLCGGR